MIMRQGKQATSIHYGGGMLTQRVQMQDDRIGARVADQGQREMEGTVKRYEEELF